MENVVSSMLALDRAMYTRKNAGEKNAKTNIFKLNPCKHNPHSSEWTPSFVCVQQNNSHTFRLDVFFSLLWYRIVLKNSSIYCQCHRIYTYMCNHIRICYTHTPDKFNLVTSRFGKHLEDGKIRTQFFFIVFLSC